MLELIFQGFVEWAYGLTLECWQYFSSALLDIMSLDFAYLRAHAPVIDDIMQVMLAVGWALLIGNLVFQAVKSMASGLGFDGEDPKILFARTFVFSFLLMASPQICEIGLGLTSTIMDILDVPDAVNVTFVDESVFGQLTAAWLLVIICGLIIMFKVFRLILEIAERYIILAMLTITAPMAFAMGGSRSTSEIFTGWCRMFGSMCLLMATNVIFFKLLLSVLSTVPSGLDVLPWMVLIMAIAKVARKADAIVTRIGLNPAITGDNLGSRLPGALTYMVIRTATSQVTKAIGKSAGSPGKGAAPSAPPGGGGGNGPRSGGPFGGRGAGGAAPGGYTQQQSTKQSAQFQNSNQQDANSQNGAVYAGAQQSAAQEQDLGGAVRTSNQFNQVLNNTQRSRKSSVPPHTRRAPNYVSPTASPMGGTAQGRTPQGDSGPAHATAQQERAAHAQALSQRQQAPHTGTAGTGIWPGSGDRAGSHQAGQTDTEHGSAVRMTQTAQTVVQGGAVSGRSQTTERTNVSAEQRSHADTPGIAGQRPGAGPHTAGATATQQAHQEKHDTRFTHREHTAGRGAQGVPAPSSAQPGTPSPGGQAGSAGTGVRFSEHPGAEPRHGRNAPPASAGTPAPTAHADPIQQEGHRMTGPAAPPTAGSSTRPHTGTAGTAGADCASVSRARQASGAPLSERTSSSGRRAQSGAEAVRKGQMPPKGSPVSPKAEVRPPRRKQGDGHGKS